MNQLRISILFLVVVFSTTLGLEGNRPTYALQSTPTSVPDAVPVLPNMTVVFIKGHTLEFWGGSANANAPLTAIQTKTWTTDHPENAIRDLNARLGSRYIYMVQGPGTISKWDMKNPAQVIQLDLTTGHATTLYEQPALVATSASPNDQKVIVMNQVNLRSPHSITCVLEISTRQCRSLNAPSSVLFLQPWGLGWLDNRRFFYSNGNNLFILDTESLTVTTVLDLTQLPGGIEDGTLIPGTHTLVIASYQSASISPKFNPPDKLLTFDIDTQQLTPLAFDAAANTGIPLSGMTGLSVSPNGQYLSYLGTDFNVEGPNNNHWLIVDLHTGKALANIQERIFSNWQQDSQHLIGLRPVPDSQTYDIAQFDLAGHASHIADYVDGTFFVVRG